MLRKIFRALWNTITVVRASLANLVFLAIVVVLVLAWRAGPEPLPERAALRLDLSGRVVDQRTRVDPGALLFGARDIDREIVLTDLIDSIDLARRDERINSLVIEPEGLLSIGQSKTTELAEAIERFRESGKPVVAVADYLTQDQYRLAVEADTVLIHPAGGVALEGFSYYANYIAEALDKLSITVNVFRAGDYKSIAEPFLRDDMSPGERAVSEQWLGDLWRVYTDAVETRRSLDPGSIDALIAEYPQRLRAAGGNPARFAAREGLVDEVLDRGQQREFLAALVGARDDDGHYTGISFEDYLSRTRTRALAPGTPAVAVVTAQGNILPGEQEPGAIGAETLSQLLVDTAERDAVKAIVLRVNSGGGSVYASEIIREELARLREGGLPVVVSMGSVAASGGYYIATESDRIVATRATITGSIGVFGAFPTFERLLERGGVYTDGVATTPLAGGLRPDRPLNPAIADALQQGVDAIYEDFLAIVSRSRGIDRATLDGIAEGRVLSAQRALDTGLVDSLGSLEDATRIAAELAGLDEGAYEVISMKPLMSPRQLLLQQLTDLLGLDRLGLSLPFAGQLLAPAREAARLVDGLADPRHLYMRCVTCRPDGWTAPGLAPPAI